MVERTNEELGFPQMGKVTENIKETPEIGVGMLGFLFMGKARANAYARA